MELPFDPPPILPEVTDELLKYLECPEKLPIHDIEKIQLYWPRVPDVLSLFEYDLSPVGTTLKFDRDPVTGCITRMKEDVLQGAGENAKNSMSMSRARGPPMEGVQGNSSNFPFWPGGFDEPELNKTTTESDLDFENNLRTLAKGFSAGIEFANDNFTPKYSLAGELVKDVAKAKPKSNSKVNLMSMIQGEGNMLGMWSESTDKKDEPLKVPDDPAQDQEDIPNIDFDESDIAVLKICVKKPKTMQAEWAEQLDVSVPVQDFDKRVPKPAILFDYPLDTFQQQAIIKLEEGCNVFVAAHTSAGKTTVAEYAIALSQRHMTRIIYTSPIKALSNQKYRDFKRNKNFDSVGLVTGDIQINQTANCLIMTTEILQTMLYNASEILRDLEYVIFDEVHYINDENRGHVWEEIVILLPPNVNIVMLSATVPNPLVFANWVGSIKKRKMFVISTLKRPVPLKHYLYTGVNGITRDNRFLLLDAEGELIEENYKKAVLSKQDEKNNKNYKKMFRKPQMTLRQEKTMWEAFISHLQTSKKLPVVIFTFSRDRCDKNADILTGIDLTTETEKGHVRSFFKKCIKCLNESDRELPQIKRMESLLQRGIGVHHSGILPILKEIIELLFQNGIVKLLFATETFAMGINMPARTVVFSSINKFDGKHFRNLLPTEYIQMAGRAGRRGHDRSGTVIIMCKVDVPRYMDLKAMMCGRPQTLQSQFKITYSMVLNLRRVSESVSVEDMMRRSFKELSLMTDSKKKRSELEEISETLAKLPPETDLQKSLSEFYHLAMDYWSEWRTLSPHIFGTKKVVKFLQPGRVILMSYRYHYQKLALVLDIRKKQDEVLYGVLCLTNPVTKDEKKKLEEKSDEWYSIIGLTKKELFFPDDIPSHTYIDIKAEHIEKITQIHLTNADITAVHRDCLKRRMQAYQNDPPCPISQIAIRELTAISHLAHHQPDSVIQIVENNTYHPELATRLKYVNTIRSKLTSMTMVQDLPNLEEHFEACFKRNELERRRRQLEFNLSDAGLALYPEYVSRVAVLKQLGYIDSDDRVTLKGRVALDMGTQELLITELIYRNILTNLQPAEIAALLSASVFQKTDPKTPDFKTSIFKESVEIMTSVRNEIENIELRHKLEPVEPLNFGLLEVVYEWARAESFAKIMDLTDVQEGIIVRCIQQLNDTLRDVKTAANRIGETVLKEKMEEASTAIKRDIVFAASLYTQD